MASPAALSTHVGCRTENPALGRKFRFEWLGRRMDAWGAALLPSSIPGEEPCFRCLCLACPVFGCRERAARLDGSPSETEMRSIGIAISV